MGAATLAAASIASTVIGGGMTAVGQMQQSRYQSAVAARQAQAAQYQAQAARWNRDYANKQAQDAVDRGREEETELRRQVAATQSDQMVKLAAAGMDVGAGTSLDILGDTEYLGELDALTVRRNAAREADGHRVRAANFEAEARGNQVTAGNYLMESSAARSAGAGQASGTILSTGGQVANRWYTYKQGSKGAARKVGRS